MANPTVSEIEKLVFSKERVARESAFVESIDCGAAIIEGDRYKIIFSEHSEEGDK